VVPAFTAASANPACQPPPNPKIAKHPINTGEFSTKIMAYLLA
jgi:hypothetical protein